MDSQSNLEESKSEEEQIQNKQENKPYVQEQGNDSDSDSISDQQKKSEEDDEEEDKQNDDVDDEDSENFQKKRKPNVQLKDKKKKKQKLEKQNLFLQKQNFVEQEAAETTSEEESNISDKEINEQEQEKLMNQMFKRKEQALKGINKMMQAENPEDLDQILEEQKKKQTIIESDFVPTSQDPKLWSVKVMPGSEKSLALQILNKAIALKGTESQLNIFSVMSVDKIKEYIFIEANAKKDVQNAIQEFDEIKQMDIEVMEPHDIRTIFKPRERQEYPVKINQFVKLKIWPYMDDLGKVIDKQTNDKYTIIVIPRVDQKELQEKPQRDEQNLNDNFENQDNFLQENKQQYKKKFSRIQFTKDNRPKKRFLTESEIEQYRKFHPREKNKFYNKYFQLKLHPRNFQFQDFQPEVPDLFEFFPDYNNIEELIRHEGFNIDKSQCQKFEIGDNVKVIKGELSGLPGIILRIIGNQIEIKSTLKKVKDNFIVKISEAVKLFQINDHVKVLRGLHVGKTGTVIDVKGDSKSEQAEILVDGNNNQITVLTMDLQISKERNYNSSNPEQIKLKQFDLVKLIGHQLVGMILSIQKDIIQILDDSNSTSTITFQQIDGNKPINTSQQVTTNSLGQTINQGSQVKITSGPYQGIQAQVKHVYGQKLFLFNDEITTNYGAIIQQVSNVYLLTPGIDKSQRPMRRNNNVVTATNDGKPINAENGQEQIKIGQKVKIKKGIHLGKQAYIRAQVGNNLTVELIQTHNKVQIRLEDLGLGKTEQSQKTQNEYIQTPYVQKSPAYSFGQDSQFNNSDDVQIKPITKADYN